MGRSAGNKQVFTKELTLISAININTATPNLYSNAGRVDLEKVSVQPQ